MKLLDSNWKFFGKVHVFDLLFLLVLVAALAGVLNRVSGGDLASMAGGSKPVPVRMTLKTFEYDPAYYQSLEAGAELVEDKMVFEGSRIVSVDLQDAPITLVDNNGDVVNGSNPLRKVALVVVEATATRKGPIYELGKQELRVGAGFFLTTEDNKLSTIITAFQPLDEGDAGVVE
ncbi:DUF4330 family protein [Anaerotalea alkaliphila]|uniref:DUF4330 family protein n=1 Tax=Anaerotalea alkaliphila TaxID=2662126 RepID=A0A7X5KL66_9FIRM|nr:DUF4330 family protein [Anaerotalea alkaliphila]NDL66511.1 DUF4330 family protein [Anaerotalea alkaliphila]